MDETESSIFFLNFLYINSQSIIENLIPVISGFTIILVLLLISGLISGSEIAFFSLSSNQIKELKKSETPVDQLIISHLDNPRKLLATILVSNNFVNITIVLISAWLTPIVFDFSNSPVLGFVFQVIIITFALLLFGEIMPKIYSRQKVMLFVRLMAKPLRGFSFIFFPLVYLLETSTNFIDRQLLKRKSTISMSELSEVVEIAHAQSKDTENEEAKILRGIATYGETEVREIMRARVDVAAINYNFDFTDLVQFIKEWGYSRFPVYTETFDNVKGVLHIKDLLPFLNKPDFNWQSLIREPFFIPENKKINDLLQDFKAKKIHIAVVVDEYGGTSGIVTLEDVIEEILGEISDEFDVKESENVFVKQAVNVWLIDAKTSINDFCKFFDLDSDSFDSIKGESDSLAGLILEMLGDFPKLGQKQNFKNIEFEVVQMDKRRIIKIKVTFL
jgi:putative hemolysin